jgi:hypothetical protein
VSRRIGVLLAAVTIVASAAATTAMSAGAQTAAPSFALAAQSSWVTPDGLFVMRFQTANVPPGSQVVLTVHDPVRSRTAFDESVSGGTLPPSRCCGSPFPFDALPADPATGQRVLVYPTTSIPDSGVYPLEVDLRNANDESLSHFVTHVVVAPVGADSKLTFGEPLQVAWVWPLRADPAYIERSPSTVNPSTLRDLQPSGRLGRQANQLAANTEVPLTLAPSPETLDAWSTLSAKFPQLAGGAAAIRSAGLRNQVLTGPFVPLDLPSIFRSDLNDVLTPERVRGTSTLETFLGAQLPDSGTALPGPLDQQSLQFLQSASVRRLVVEGTQLTSANEKFTPAHPYRLETVPGDDSSAVTVAASDPGLEEFLTGNDPPALRAAHLLAGLALIAGEQPSITRGITLINPDRWDADDTFVAAMLAGFRNNPLLHPNTVAGLLAAVPPATVDGEPDGAPVYRQLAPYDAPPAPVTAKEYQRATNDRQGLADLVGTTSPQTARADRALASVVSADWQNPAGRFAAGELLGSIRTSLDTVRTQIGAQVRLQQPGTITITSSKAQIPISFQNVSNASVVVHLKLESDRLLFPDGAEQDVTLPPSRSTTVRVAVETRGSGRSPVQLTVTTANGVPVGSTRITVRSTFVSGVGVFLTVGAIVFLAIWWGWDIHRRRKRRSQSHHPSFPVATPSGQPA